MMKNIFSQEVATEVIARINQLQPSSQPLWGKMNVAQMLAHCNVTYAFVYDNTYPPPSKLKKWILKLFVKKIVVNEKPFSKNSATSPEFLVAPTKVFDTEKQRLIDYILQTQKLGGDFFNGKESHSFGALTTAEWNNMFYKHLDHHLRQFGI